MPAAHLRPYSYDADGNRVQETDPLGQTRQWIYTTIRTA